MTHVTNPTKRVELMRSIEGGVLDHFIEKTRVDSATKEIVKTMARKCGRRECDFVRRVFQKMSIDFIDGKWDQRDY